MREIRRRIFTVSLLIGIFQWPLILFASSRPPTPPKYVGQTLKFQGKVFTAIKLKVKGKTRLSWDAGRAIVIPLQSPPISTPAPSPTVTTAPKIHEKRDFVIAQSSEVELNSVKRFEGVNRYGFQKGYLVIRNENGLIALGDTCTHQGCVVMIEKDGFHCPCHNALFDLKNGQVLRGPAAHPLESFPIREDAGKIIVND